MANESPHVNRYRLFPQTIAKAVEPVLKPIYKKHGFAEHRLLTEWRAIVGDELAACSVPQKLTSGRQQDGGTLHVLVASARALEMQHMEPIILEKISVYFGYNAVKKIKLIQSSADMLRKKKLQNPHKKAAISEKLLQAVNECTDEKLRNVLLSLGSLIDN